ncbi:C39 family peptidase [Marinicrinis sediminis]|uniref:C39 family peptidase n=1 Tax=Marinicrinis sediminis TaxID=1652465 RepID=A0ABW5R5K5_9BACL
MKWFKIAKGFSISLLIASLMFTSSVFTAILYAKIKYRPADSHAVSGYDPASGTDQAADKPEQNQTEGEETKVNPAAMLEAPLIQQYPELPRGCEITTLTMLLQFSGVEKGKMELVEELPWDHTPIQWGDQGQITYWGHPNEGFVGDITLGSPGFGVYHKPIATLLSTYQSETVDLTGKAFSEIEASISNGIPVMVWTTVNYKVPVNWMEWDSPQGKVKTTTKEHTVLVVGYDEEHVYVNDPLKKQKQLKINKQQFVSSWEAMGKQAVTYREANRKGS